MSDQRAASGTVERFLAGFGLRGSESDEWHGIPDDVWRVALPAAARQRLTGLAVAALEVGCLTLSRGQTAALIQQQEAAMSHALKIERHLLELSGAFSANGVEPIVLKGPALAHTFYPDPSWRPFGDLDVLVRSEDWSRSCELLVKLGHRRQFLEPRAGFSKRFGRTALHISADGLEVDLHRGLASGPYIHWVHADDLFEAPASFELGGLTLHRLSDTAAFLHACMHASLGSRRPLLMPLRDVAQIAASGTVDWNRVRSLSGAWKLRAVVRHALQTAHANLEVRLPPEAEELSDTLTPSKQERDVLDAFTTERRRRGARAFWALRATPGIWRKATYARAMLVPDREFMASSAARRHPSYVGRWKTALRGLKSR